MSKNDSDTEQILCNLMAQLKMNNPEAGRKEIHSLVLAEGSEWENVTVEDISSMWRRMKRRNAKNKENISGTSKKNSESNGHLSKENQSTDDSNACESKGAKDKFGKGNSKNKKTAQTKTDAKEINESEVASALMGNMANKGNKVNSNQSPALLKQLKYLEENRGVNYVVFTPTTENNDFAIKLVDAMGEVFFYIMWNRMVSAPFGSKSVKRELWMIYQQLEGNLLPKYKKLLRNQLQEEFGLDPFDGK